MLNVGTYVRPNWYADVVVTPRSNRRVPDSVHDEAVLDPVVDRALVCELGRKQMPLPVSLRGWVVYAGAGGRGEG